MNQGKNIPGPIAAGVFSTLTAVIFILSVSAAESVGFVPYYIDGTPSRADRETGVLALNNLPVLGEEPVEEPAQETRATLPPPTGAGSTASKPTNPQRIVIGAIDMNLPVQNPATRDIGKLDEMLKDGPVRYVDSAQLGARGNVLIFAHTSHLPVVHNQMYKAFNRVPELKPGNVITLKGEDGKSYLYSVTSVRKANASDETINLAPSIGQKLTLVTCDTLTSKDSRYILEADFVGTVDGITVQ